MIEEPIFWDYATFNEDGFLNGIRKDSPDHIKAAYAEYLEEERKNKDNGLKL